jgi:hypothetical protein
MRTIRTKVFKFNELSETAKDRAISKLSDINTDHNWYEYTLENMSNMLSENGFNNAEICFSGFSSQGDGASFDAEIDLNAFTTDKRIIAIAENYCMFRIDKTSNAGHYSHEKTRYAEYNALDEKFVRINSALQNLSDKIEQKRLALSKQIYRIMKTHLQNGDLSEYGFACGYVQPARCKNYSV